MIRDNNSEMLFVFLTAVVCLLCIFAPIIIVRIPNSFTKKRIKIPRLAHHIKIDIKESSCNYYLDRTPDKADLIESMSSSYNLCYSTPNLEISNHNLEDLETKNQSINPDSIIKSMKLHSLMNRIYVLTVFIIIFISIVFIMNIDPYGYSDFDFFDIINAMYIVLIMFSAVLVSFHIFAPVVLNYDMSDIQSSRYQAFISALKHIFSCKCVRESVGHADLFNVSLGTLPFGLITNIKPVIYKTSAGKLFFMPDKLYLLSNGTFRFYDYSSVKISCNKIEITEHTTTYSDEEVIGKKWLHQTKSGKPDRRYKDNPQYNVCLCGEIRIQLDNDCCVSLITSNHKIIDEL